MCNNSDLLIGFVYGEIGADERAAFESHLAACAACRNEVAEMRAARGHLAAWTPPEPDFGFQIVRSQGAARTAPPAGGRVLRPARWFAPAWGLAAAAVLVLAAAAAIANVEIRYDAQGLVVRTGWARDAGPGAADAQSAVAADVVPVSREELAALNRRLTDLERVASTQNAGSVQLAAGPRMSDAEMLRRMRDMLNRSEARQQRELATQITQVIRDVDTVRQIDYARYQQGIGQLRGQTAAALSRVSQQK